MVLCPAAGSDEEATLPNQQLPQRKKIRLDHDLYADTTTICSVTLCTDKRRDLFADTALADACLVLLRSQAEARSVAAHAYCFMSDHLHLVIAPSPEASVPDFLRDFKGLSTRIAWERGYEGKLWQPRFFDHFLRKDEDLRRAVDYIVNNPVRKGMVVEWREYSYCGSLVYDL